jgi:hypothetical protein
MMAEDIRLGFLWMKYGWSDVVFVIYLFLLTLGKILFTMRFIIVLLLFTTLSATSQNSEVLTWDVEYSIENINADSSIIKTLLSMISNQKTKINYFLHENNLVNIATYDSLNEIRTVMLKDESHTYVFVTLDGITTYKKKPISDLNTKNNNGPLTSEEIPIVKFIENKMDGCYSRAFPSTGKSERSAKGRRNIARQCSCPDSNGRWVVHKLSTSQRGLFPPEAWRLKTGVGGLKKIRGETCRKIFNEGVDFL